MYRLKGIRGVFAPVFQDDFPTAGVRVQKGGQVVDGASDDDPAAGSGFVFGYFGSTIQRRKEDYWPVLNSPIYGLWGQTYLVSIFASPGGFVEPTNQLVKKYLGYCHQVPPFWGLILQFLFSLVSYRSSLYLG